VQVIHSITCFYNGYKKKLSQKLKKDLTYHFKVV